MSSNLDAGLISRELAERLGQMEVKNEPEHGEYELVEIRQQQIIGDYSQLVLFGCTWLFLFKTGNFELNIGLKSCFVVTQFPQNMTTKRD